MDWSTLAINTTRPLAVLAAIQFAAVAKPLPDEATIGEALASLATHLDRSRDASLAVRSVFGQRYGTLARVAGSWTAENWYDSQSMTRSRPGGGSLGGLSGLQQSEPGSHPRTEPRSHIAAMTRQDRPDWRVAASPLRSLGEHLVVALVRGWIPIEGGILANAQTANRSELWVEMLNFAGRALKTEALTPEQVARLQEFWMSRRQAVARGQGAAEETHSDGGLPPRTCHSTGRLRSHLGPQSGATVPHVDMGHCRKDGRASQPRARRSPDRSRSPCLQRPGALGGVRPQRAA